MTTGGTPRATLLLTFSLLALLGAEARAQSFSDFSAVGRLSDSRREPSPLRVDLHTLEPAIVYKLLGVTTPHVYGAVGGGYTDNLLRGDSEAAGVEIQREVFGRVEAGLRLDTAFSDHRLELDYRARVYEYAGSGEFDRLEQDAGARLDLLWNDVEAHADLFWRRQAFPRQIQLRGLVRAEQLGTNLWGEARFGKLGLRLGGHYRSTDYLQRSLDFFDQDDYGLDVQVHTELLPKLRALVEYNWFVVAYDDDVLEDYQVHQVRAGVDGELTPKLHGSLKLGLALQQVDDSESGDTREYTGFSAETAVRWSPFAFTRLLLAYTRRLEPSISSNFLISDAVRFDASQGLWEDLVELGFGIGYTHSVVQRGEHINRLDVDLRAIYQVKDWLSVGATYTFTTLESGFPDSDYDVHTVYASIGFGL